MGFNAEELLKFVSAQRKKRKGYIYQDYYLNRLKSQILGLKNNPHRCLVYKGNFGYSE